MYFKDHEVFTEVKDRRKLITQSYGQVPENLEEGDRDPGVECRMKKLSTYTFLL